MRDDGLRIDEEMRAEDTVTGQIERLQDLCDRRHSDGETISRDMLEIIAIFPRLVMLFSLLYEELCEYQPKGVRESTSLTWRKMLQGEGERKGAPE